MGIVNSEKERTINSINSRSVSAVPRRKIIQQSHSSSRGEKCQIEDRSIP